MTLFSELRRRNVLRMAALYLVTAWLVMQVAEVLMGLAALPEWMGRAVLGVLAIGLPIALVLSWFYEVTPGGVKRDSGVDEGGTIGEVAGRRVDFVIISVLAAAVVLFAYDKWWVGGPPEKSIAVLAFENMSGDPAQEYFSDGISEEILNLLAQMPGLTVISRSSAFSFKGKNTPIPEVAAQLNVAHVLEGSVRRAGDRVRITAQLIQASSDSHLWSRSYDRDLDDVFAVQDEIAGAISEVLKLRLAGMAGEAAMPSAIATASPAAYDAYLKGRELIAHRTRDALQEAIGHLERSISLDNGFAPAHAQLAIATLLSRGYSNEEGRRIAALHLERAEELEPDLAEAHAGRALYALNALYAVGRVAESDALHEREIVIDPLSIVARRTYAMDLMHRGRYAEAHAIADRIIAQSPSAGYGLHAAIAYLGEGNLVDTVSWGLRSSRSHIWARDALLVVGEFDEARRISFEEHWVDFTEGRWEDAIRKSQEILGQYPGSAFVASDTANVLFLARRFDEALALYERALELSLGSQTIRSVWWQYYMTQLALARRKAGDEEGAEAAAIQVRQSVAQKQPAHKDWMEDVYAAMIAAFDGDADRAITALTSGLRHGMRAPWIFVDPVFDDLHDDPRFVALRQELDEMLAQEHEKILQLICFDNPVPDEWQPLPETCEGVVESAGL
jgi:TolB-like protein